MPEGEPSPTEIAYTAIRRVERRIEPEWPGGMRFFVSPPVLFLFMLVAAVLGFLVMMARFRARLSGGF